MPHVLTLIVLHGSVVVFFRILLKYGCTTFGTLVGGGESKKIFFLFFFPI